MFNGRCKSIFHSFHVLIHIGIWWFWGLSNVCFFSGKIWCSFSIDCFFMQKPTCEKYIWINNDLTSFNRTQEGKNHLIYCILGLFFLLSQQHFSREWNKKYEALYRWQLSWNHIPFFYSATLTVISGFSPTIKCFKTAIRFQQFFVRSSFKICNNCVQKWTKWEFNLKRIY